MTINSCFYSKSNKSSESFVFIGFKYTSAYGTVRFILKKSGEERKERNPIKCC